MAFRMLIWREAAGGISSASSLLLWRFCSNPNVIHNLCFPSWPLSLWAGNWGGGSWPKVLAVLHRVATTGSKRQGCPGLCWEMLHGNSDDRTVPDRSCPSSRPDSSHFYWRSLCLVAVWALGTVSGLNTSILHKAYFSLWVSVSIHQKIYALKNKNHLNNFQNNFRIEELWKWSLSWPKKLLYLFIFSQSGCSV